MRLLVTGGAGFIGSHIIEAALEVGHEVAALDNLSSGKKQNLPAGVKLFEVDLRDRSAVSAAIGDFRPDMVSHQAAQASVSISVKSPLLDAETNVIGGINLLDACREFSVRKVVFASTGGAIYGEVPEGRFASEDMVPVPISPYAIDKLCFEQLLGVYRVHHGLDSCVLRYANVYGPRQDPHGEAGVVAIFFMALLAKRKITVFARREAGDPGCVRDYVYVSDVARANIAALSDDWNERVMNVGTGRAITTLELVKLMAACMGSEVTPGFGPMRAGDAERSVLDIKRFAARFGANVSLEAGLERTFAWYRSQG
ncbi:MAG TPA: NAD-dependent epimerase/dehydratase family protein [Polyangiaceae bacterium]|jgi:UDP-glucose 4-epimerase